MRGFGAYAIAVAIVLSVLCCASLALASDTTTPSTTIGSAPVGNDLSFIDIGGFLQLLGGFFRIGVTAPSSGSGSTSDLYTPGPSQALFNNPFYTCSTNYYVSTTGSNSNNGSINSPWLTIQHAANQSSIGAGSCINVEPGTYASGATITYGGNAATPTGYVVYRCTQLDACKITAAGYASGGFMISGVDGPDYVVFDGFELAANAEDTYSAGIVSIDGEGSEDDFASHHIWVLNNIVHGYGEAGISLNDGEYFYIIHNTAYNNANVTCDAQGSGIAIVVPKAIPGSYTPTAMDTAYGFKNVVEYNISYDNILTQCGTGSDPYDTDGNGIIFDTWDGSGTTYGQYAGSGIAAFNLVYQNGAKGITVFRNSAATIVIANNTSYDNNLDPFNLGGATAEINLNGSANTTVINNIAYPVPATSPSDPRCQGVNYSMSPWDLPYECPLQGNSSYAASDYNGGGGTDVSVTNTYLSDVFSNDVGAGGTPYYSSDGHGDALGNGNTINCATGVNPNLCETNPLFTSTSTLEFTLQPGSPAIGYGLGTETYLPTPPLDAGAYQYNGTKVSLTAPVSGADLSRNVTLTAYSTSATATISSVQFEVDGTDIGSAISSSPYTTTWNSQGVSDGTHTLYAVAEDTSGNYATSSESVTVDNDPPVISAIASSTSETTATITWTTDKAASSTVAYGTTTSYGSASSSASYVTSHSISLTGLATSTTYHFQIQSTDGGGNLATSSDLTFTTNYSTWDPTIQPSLFTYTNGNNTVTCTGCTGNYPATKGTNSHTSGSYYYEITLTTLEGFDYFGAGNSVMTTASATDLGDGTNTSIGWDPYNGNIQVDNAVIATVETAVQGDVVGFVIDDTNHVMFVRVYHAGSWGNWNNNASITSPCTSPTGGFSFSGLAGGTTMFPAASIGNTNTGAVTLNTGGSPFQGSGLPSGCSAWQ